MKPVHFVIIVLALLLLLLWMQSVFAGRTLHVSAPSYRYVFITSASGRLVVYWSTGVQSPRTRPPDHGLRLCPAARSSVAHRGRSQSWRWFGAEAGTVVHGTLDSAHVWTWGFNVPWWYLVAPAAATALICLRKLMRDWGEGLCANCGYDLRATPDRCPECGTTVSPRAK